MSSESNNDSIDESIDPRVQVELERLNVATDEINRLEVDLDESRNNFRHILTESSGKIENCSKKLGHCIAKSRPYYDARLKAKEALRETQKMAAKFERANSAHAAAKEMVFLAEEGLKTEGRTFDHAWQEMLNHATMRVNESEADRTSCEVEHKRSSQFYQMSEIRVQTLQRTLKKSISKSRPYFELKIHYNQILEEQKNKVKALEKQVTDTKLGYAETLRNLEQISDEIHQSRHNNKSLYQNKTGDEANTSKTISNKTLKSDVNPNEYAEQCEDNKNNLKLVPTEIPLSDSGLSKNTPTSCSSNLDTDVWSEATEAENFEGLDSTFGWGWMENDADRDSIPSENDSSITGMQDSESDDDLKSNRFSSPVSSIHQSEAGYKILKSGSDEAKNENERGNSFDGYGICSFPVEADAFFDNFKTKTESEWTEIKLTPGPEEFATMQKRTPSRIDDFDIPYSPLSEVDNEATVNAAQTPSEPSIATCNASAPPDNSLASWISNNMKNGEKKDGTETIKCVPVTPKKIMNIRRQSLDVLWNTATGEKMKEILSQSIFKLNIGSLNDRRHSEIKTNDDKEVTEGCEDTQGSSSYEANISSQFGLQFFSKKKTDDEQIAHSDKHGNEGQEPITNQVVSRKEKFFIKKVPSPLERTLSFLSADDDSASDTDSLPSVDMLTDEQLSALVLDQDFAELYHDILQ